MSDEPRSEADGDPPIKVTDRRKFDREGHLRPDAPEAAATPQVEEDQTGGNGPDPEESLPLPRPPAREDATPGVAGALPKRVDFQQFVYFLYMSSLHELGVPTEAGGPPRPPDLDRARFFIDVLQILKEKTAGNLVGGEEKLLEEVLYNLQMQYVAASRASGTPTA